MNKDQLEILKRQAIEHEDKNLLWLVEQAEKAERLEESLKTIIKLTNCDDTWDFANQTLEGKEKEILPYRFNQI